MTNIAESELIDGRYRLEQLRARVPGTDTWCAYDIRLDRHVVLDVLTSDEQPGGLAAVLAARYADVAGVLDAGDRLGPDGAGYFVVTGIVDTFQPVPLAVAVPAADLGDVRTGRRRSNAVLFPAAGVA